MITRRIGRLRKELQQRHLDALLVTSLPHVRYLTNFSGSHGACLVRQRGVTFFTDSRYGYQATREVRNAVTITTASDLVAAAGESMSSMPLRVGFEADHLSVQQFRLLKRAAHRKSLVATSGLVERLASIKEKEEVASIRKALSISEAVFREILPEVRPGVRESDLAAEISFRQKGLGAGADAFEPIVASGKRSAFPHARATRHRLRSGNMLILDFGCTVNGYHSDLTRTVVVGRASSQVRKLYSAVLEARDRAVDSIRPGVRVSTLDGIARRALDRYGLQQYFSHSLGHGVGLSIHERPRISALSTESLHEGNVVTIEPGVYLPGVGGIRIEDLVLVTRTGCEVLNKVSRNLTVI